MKRSSVPFILTISVLLSFINFMKASTNCDTLHLINGNKLLIMEHKFHDTKFHFYTCDDELLEEKHIIDKKSIVKIAAYPVPPVKEKEVVKATKKVKRKRIKKKVKKEKKYTAHLKLKDGGKVKGLYHSRTSDAVMIELNGELKRYNFSDLKSLQKQKKGKLAAGLGVGVLTGLGLALLQWSGSSSSYFPGPKESIQIATVSTIGATLATLLVVNARVNIPLNRRNKKRNIFKLKF